MNKISSNPRAHEIPLEERRKILARVYLFILSFPDPGEKITEPAATNLGRDAEAGSATDTHTDQVSADGFYHQSDRPVAATKDLPNPSQKKEYENE